MMTFGPQKNEIYNSSKEAKSGDVDPVIKFLVAVVVAVGCITAICSVVFGHNWMPPS